MRRSVYPLNLLVILATLLLAAACAGRGSGDDPGADSLTLSPFPSATPAPSPTPPPTLEKSTIWLSFDGANTALASVTLDGRVARIGLPLNMGQTASNITASKDALTLAYIVWNSDNTQHGIAVWPVEETDARLIAPPLDGYRVVAIYLSDDSQNLVYLQVEEGRLPEEADWRIDTIDPSGGDPALITNRELSGGLLPLVPFAWPDGGPLLFQTVIPTGRAVCYALNTDTGSLRELFSVDGMALVSPMLSPDGSQLAYTTGSHHSAAAGDGDATAFYVLDLLLDETRIIQAPEDYRVLGLRWNRTGSRLLLDMIRSVPDDPGQTEQVFALVGIDSQEWVLSPRNIGLDRLFDYEPLGNGLIYTTLPDDRPPALHILADIEGEKPSYTISLDPFEQETGAPLIIHLP